MLTNTVWAFFITIKLQDACLLLFYKKCDYLRNEQSQYGKCIAGVVHALPLDPYKSKKMSTLLLVLGQHFDSKYELGIEMFLYNVFCMTVWVP